MMLQPGTNLVDFKMSNGQLLKDGNLLIHPKTQELNSHENKWEA
jgi:hypothetical protein